MQKIISESTDLFIFESDEIKSALKKLDKTGKKVLLVTNDSSDLLGTISDGDIRRYILSGKSLNGTIEEAYNKNPIRLIDGEYTDEQARQLILKHEIELVPIVDHLNKIRKYLTWDQLFTDKKKVPFHSKRATFPVVIMAGGKGMRLDPFTRILPKALLPVGEKAIVEIIIEEFKQQGVNQFYLTVNHKAEMIESYFDGIDKQYLLSYIREDDYLGTAGSLKYLEYTIESPFLVSNCDVLIKTDFAQVEEFHKKENAVLTILSPIQHYKIPYGVIDCGEGGVVCDIREKPEYTFIINAGVYMVSAEALAYIPEKSRFDMTDLIKDLIANKKKVIMYPVNESDYVDIGQWEEYKKNIDAFRTMGLLE